VIDLYQCHWPDFTAPEEEMMEALLELQDRGKIRAFGVCNFDKPMMERCTAAAPLASIQPPYSLLSRDIEAEIMPFCREQGIGVICYSPMYQGLLTGKIKPGHTFGDGDIREGNPWFKGEKLESVNEVLAKVVTPIADSHDATLGQVAVAWCLAQPGITAAIVGARNAKQAESNVAAGDLRLSKEELDAITQAFDRLLETG
jgi:aryl-alcohol dehydrogenase-like predicted oxidoreductase